MLYSFPIKDSPFTVEVHQYTFGQHRVMVTDGETTAVQF
jgi:hypothetical protein